MKGRRVRARAGPSRKVLAVMAVTASLAGAAVTLALRSTAGPPSHSTAAARASNGKHATTTPSSSHTSSTSTTPAHGGSSSHPASSANGTHPGGSTSPTSPHGGASPTGGAGPAATVTAQFRPDVVTARGIYEFSGGNSATDAENPDLVGTTLTFEWADLEPTAGQFTWSRIDNAIAPWAAAGKRVILRVSAGGQAAWGASAAEATPAWVYAQGVPSINDGGSILPEYWNPTFLADYDTFIAAYAAHYDGNPDVSFIEMGIGDGGETMPDTQEGSTDHLAQWAPYGYSDAVWLATVEDIASTYREDFVRTPVVPLVDSSFWGPTRTTDYLNLTSWFADNGFPMQYDGLTSTSTPQNSNWQKTTIISEQRGPTSSSGDTLSGDCASASGSLESRVILIYQADIDNPANQSALDGCAMAAGA
jgi:Beta-galactosidase